MLLTYHKIHPETSSVWWVTPNEFWRQMEELRRFKVVLLDEYDPKDPKKVTITFDGVYENVFTYAFPILRKFGYPFELFIIGCAIGKNNDFDPGEPLTTFANQTQLRKMVEGGGRLQWHSWSHKDLSKTNNQNEIKNEIYIPDYIRDLDPKGFSWFAYPHGRFSPFAQDFLKKYFKGAVSCDQGEETDFYNLKRVTVTNRTSFSKTKVSLIIANYNYGRFAAEAIESAIHQSVTPDEILFIDDCSTDNSMDVANRYKDQIWIVRNEKNLGIIDNFNKAVSLTKGDYICFLGADNRFRSDYVEKCKFALDNNPDAAIAYTNVLIFGPRAEVLAVKVNANPIEGQKDMFLWKFPEFTEETKKTLKSRNFIHGSSMYRRIAFEEVGGYKKSNGPEDHNLFIRIIDKGWRAVLCPEFLLEYRQHSNDQANTYLNMGLELAFLRRQYNLLIRQLSAFTKKEKVIQETIGQVSACAHQGKIEEAMEIIRETFRKFPEHGKMILQYALLLKLKGSVDQAEQYFNHALLYDPNLRNFEKNFHSRKICGQKENHFIKEIACKNESRIVKANSPVKEFPYEQTYQKIQALLKDGMIEEAILVLEKFLKNFPDHILANNDLGVLYFEIGDMEKALEKLEKAYQIDSQNIYIMKNLADVHAKKLNLEKALSIYQKILSLNPKDIDVYNALGELLFSTGRMDDAFFWWQKTLEIDPNNKEANIGIKKIKGEKEVELKETNTFKEDYNTLSENQRGVEVSIVIPVHNQLEYTQNCLKSIFELTNIFFELIIVDNGSTDGTKEYLKQMTMSIKNLTPLLLDDNKGFGEACNLAAKIAKGKYLVFLNNDTEVTPGWLNSLTQFMGEHPECGAVGAKLVYPDGRLQEAGGIIFSDGTGWNYGRGLDPSDPRFNFVREVDYCSGAALMVRKDLWDEIGGFDLRYAPAYYEDTDLCFEIRKRGYKVYYQPKSVVIHHEGKTAGTNLQTGFKKFQEINRVKFIEKWRNELKKQYINNPRNVVKASDRQADKNILVIDAFLPFYDRASGSYRLFQILKILKKMRFHITFLARYGSLENQYRPMLEDMGIEVYAGDYEAMKAVGYKNNPWGNIQYNLLFQYRSYDFALIEFWEVANYYVPIIRKLSPQTKIIIDSVDIHFVREIREAELKGSPELKKKALLNKEKEIATYKQADRIWVVTETDRNSISSIIEDKPIDVIPNIHEQVVYKKLYEESSDLLFVGNFNHPPNRDAILFFCKDIFPTILNKLPEVKLYIVGNNPPEEIKALSSPQVIVTGYVPDLSPYFKRARISVNPLRYGAGMKGKIGEALSWGLPVVTTSIGAEGMGLIDGQEALIADSPEEFAQKVIRVYQDPILWRSLSDNGKRKIKENWTPEAICKRLVEVFEPKKLDIGKNLVSLIILTHNQLEYTKMCLESIFQHTDVPFELIIVDNGSQDGTPGYLREIMDGNQLIAGRSFIVKENGDVIEKRYSAKKKKKKIKKDFYCRNFRVLLNENNLGFAAGNNQGIAEAKGEYILIMNNDVVVTPGWLKRMLAVAERKPEIGIVGPMSNYVSGPQLVKEIKYNPDNLNGLNQFAMDYAQKNHEKARPFWRVVGFCILIKRAVVEKIGGFDERYALGNFEDDDFSLRARIAGFESWIAKDCFIHHFGNRTFLGAGIDYSESLKKNWEIFKRKWGIPQEIEYGADYDLGWILKQGFNPVQHYFPITPDRLTISQAEELFNLGDADGAKVLFEKILFYDPKNIEALNDLGVIYFHQGEFDRAISYFYQVLELNEDHPEALENLGNCMVAQGRFKEAIPWFNKVLNFKPKDISLLNSLANCFIQLDEFSKAKEIYKKSYQIDNNQVYLIEIIKEMDKMKELENQGGMVT